MFVSCPFDHPNDYFRPFARSIGNQLTEMIMIRIFELIFDNNFSIGTIFRCEYVDIEISHGRFPLF